MAGTEVLVTIMDNSMQSSEGAKKELPYGPAFSGWPKEYRGHLIKKSAFLVVLFPAVTTWQQGVY